MTATTADAPALADTNIVIYAYDPADAAKHARAKELLESLSDAGHLAYSTQVLNEFCSVMMRAHRAAPLSPDEAAVVVDELAATGDILPIALSTTLLALGAMPHHGLSFWDALIWATALENGIATVYTEDFQHGREVEGVRFVNPFLPAKGP